MQLFYNHNLGDHIGNAAGSGVVGPSGKHCCRYCDVIHDELHDVSLLQCCSLRLRNPQTYQDVQLKVDTFRKAGRGFQGKADELLTQYGYTEGLVS